MSFFTSKRTPKEQIESGRLTFLLALKRLIPTLDGVLLSCGCHAWFLLSTCRFTERPALNVFRLTNDPQGGALVV